MWDKLKSLYEKYKEIIHYLIFGVATTIVNWATYSVFVKFLQFGVTPSNIIAWVFSVAFAYITNKIWVFDSKSWSPRILVKEVISFVGSRLVSGVFEIVMLPVAISLGLNQSILGVEGFVAKILISVIVVIINYVFSKFLVFRKKKQKPEQR